MIAGLAARIVASGVDDVLGDVHGELSLSASYAWAQQAGCNDILDRADKGIDMINTLTDLGGYDPPAGERVDDMHSYAFDEWWGWVKRTTRQIDSALGGNACPESPPGPAGPGGSASPSGMGAAVPPGGNMGGNALPPGYRPIPDYARGPAPMATELARGRFVMSVAASGSAVMPIRPSRLVAVVLIRSPSSSLSCRTVSFGASNDLRIETGIPALLPGV